MIYGFDALVKEIDSAIHNQQWSRREYEIGVCDAFESDIDKLEKGYLAKYNHEHLGVYPTVEEAYYRQTQKKKEAIIELVNDYRNRNIIPQYIYDIVVAYEFDIRNDRNYVA